MNFFPFCFVFFQTYAADCECNFEEAFVFKKLVKSAELVS